MKPFVVVVSVLLLWVGFAGAVDSNEKLALLESAVSGDQEAQFRLAGIYKDESEAEDYIFRDMKLLARAVHWYEKAAENGSLQSMYVLLDIYTSSFDEPNPVWQEKWLSLAEKMSKKGDKIAQFKLAEYYERERYYEGTNVVICVQKAVHLYSTILKHQSPSQNVVFKSGQVKSEAVSRYDIKNKIKDLKAIDIAAEDRDKKTKFLYRNATEKGSLADVIKLGDFWVNNKGEQQNIKMAKKAYLFAAIKKSTEAQLKLARLLYQKSKGLYDYQEAYFWAMAALVGKEKGATGLLSDIEKKLPKKDLPAMEVQAKKAIKKLNRD